jgi:hypothetical protein
VVARLTASRQNHSRAEWSHFSAGARVFLGSQTCGGWEEALQRAGSWLIAFRRRYGLPTDERTKNRDRDYEWAAKNGTKPREAVPDRAGFGLPLPFTKENIVTWRDSGDREQERRASPLLIHVARFGKDYRPALTYLPSRLVPSGEGLCFKQTREGGPGGPTTTVTPRQEGIVDDFLDDLLSKKLAEDAFA